MSTSTASKQILVRLHQVRTSKDSQWGNVDSERSLRDAMQRACLYYSEIQGHVEDLLSGHVLTADNGKQFRIIEVDMTPRANAAGYTIVGINGSAHLASPDNMRQWLYGFGSVPLFNVITLCGQNINGAHNMGDGVSNGYRPCTSCTTMHERTQATEVGA